MKFTGCVLGSLLRTVSLVCLTFAALTGLAAVSPDLLDDTHANVRAVMALQGEVTESLMQSTEILGTAVGVDASGAPALVIFVDKDAPGVSGIVRGLPPQMRGIGVALEMTEKFRTYKRPSRNTTSHTALQSAPIQLGTSGGWRNDYANGYCCGGTLGSLVQVNGVQYLLSNYHVMEADIVSGGNNLVAHAGSFVIQPGLIDVRCSASSAQNVATLVKLSSLPGFNVDVGVAQIIPGMVRADGAILEIGTISSTTLAPALNQPVKKSGRTTGLTRSRISGLNATISVTYENECAGGTAFSKTFTGQIVVANSGNQFLNGGDSGSLMVEDVSINPRSVGLLFAGSSTRAIANPISQVLQFLSTKLNGTATMVGY